MLSFHLAATPEIICLHPIWSERTQPMSARRFFAYCVVAAWLALTPVAIMTGLDWSAEAITVQLAYEHPNNAPGADDHLVNAFRIAEIKRIQFWWEAGVWAGLTLLGAALLAEQRHHRITLETRATETHEAELSASALHSELR